MSIKSLIYKLGIAMRNPSLLDHYHFLKETEHYSREELKRLQFETGKEFLCFAGKYSPYWKEKFEREGFDPQKMTSWDDLKKLAPIAKNDLLTDGDKIKSVYPFQKLQYSETSGTSGQVLFFPRNEEWDSFNRAGMFRGYSWYGIKPFERNGYLWGYNINPKARRKVQFLDWLQNRFRCFSYSEEDVRRFTEKLQSAEFLSGYSSMIYEIARLVNEMGMNPKYHLKMIKGTSEKIYPSYQEEVKKAFGQKIISEYGAGEAGLIAFECPEGGNMHINMEHVYVEVEDGEILVTNFLSRSYPIIRYKLGDAVTLADPDFVCPCGRKHQVVLDVLGRVGKNIYGKKSIYPSLTFYYLFKNIALEHGVFLNYQAIQKEKGAVVLNIEKEAPEFLPFIQREIVKYFKDDVVFSVHFGVKLHEKNGKLKDFISEIQ